MSRYIKLLNNPIKSMTYLYVCWKIILLVVAVSSPGSGYDTSSSLYEPISQSQISTMIDRVTQKLTRWDAIYFVNISRRGYIYEQEWAFGWGMTRFLGLCTAGLKRISGFAVTESVAGILIANSSHFLSVIILFYLTLTVFPEESIAFAFGTACLHIISPAGIFLSAPFAESSCALLSFIGYILFMKSICARRGLLKDALILTAGIFFGAATTFRSNGSLNGILLTEVALRAFWDLRDEFDFPALRHLLATGIGGLFVAMGILIPQYIAYSEYCLKTFPIERPWCNNVIPSIYTFVQGHYWNVGLFRYWNLPNLPLFLLATPTLLLMVASAIWAINFESLRDTKFISMRRGFKNTSNRHRFLCSMATIQLIIASITLFTAHVQIITRISSSYPIWIWFLATFIRSGRGYIHRHALKYMVIYGIVQAGLYSSFLPPA